MTQNTAL